MYRPEPLPLSIWIVNPFDDIPGEGLPPLRYWSLARVLACRGHDVTWWTAAWSHRRKAPRSTPLLTRDEEGFAVRLVAVRPYTKNVSFARLASHRDFGRTFERLAHESIASGQLERPDVILASLPPLEGPEAAASVFGTSSIKRGGPANSGTQAPRCQTCRGLSPAVASGIAAR